MGRPKGSKNKPKTDSPIHVVEPLDDDFESDEPMEATPSRPVSPDLDITAIYDGLQDIQRVEENITDIKRTQSELEAEFATIKADFSKRIKTVKAVLDDNINALEKLTHTEVFDRSRGQVYLVHNSKVSLAEDVIRWISECDDPGELESLTTQLDTIAKTHRALELDDSQEALPFAAEG